MHKRILCGIIVVCLLSGGIGRAAESRTSLIIEGGGLPPDCPALKRFVVAARIEGRLRIGYLPTASTDPAFSAARFISRLGRYGVAPEQIQIIDLTVANALEQAENPTVVAQVRECTAIFFGGGDQTRIIRALVKPGGVPTAVLKAIYAASRSGRVIAGTSAGAAVQSETMISVSGLPDDLIDDGMDALDFGITKSLAQPARRGLLVTRGLAFFRAGIIDQHFSQYRGRLGRLARAAIEEKVRFGFGIDEDAALAVAADGTIEILGPGRVTIVDANGATCKDGPLGCSIAGVHLACLGHGDRFDPKTGLATIHPGKAPIAAGKEAYNGNFLIPDIAGQGAVLQALTAGLGNNTSQEQIGITLKYNRHYGHGYRHKFVKTALTKSYQGIVEGIWQESVTCVRLDIEPITQTLRTPETGLPRDISQEPMSKALEAVLFRGLLVADDQNSFRPNEPITRGDLASAIAQTLRLEMPRINAPEVVDAPDDERESQAITMVVGASLMKAEGGKFRPGDSISRQEAAAVLVRFMERYRSETLPVKSIVFPDSALIEPRLREAVFAAHGAMLLQTQPVGIRPKDLLTRSEAAVALYRIVGFPWRA
jgi:cyanophycinase